MTGFNVGDLVWFTNPKDGHNYLATVESGNPSSTEYSVRTEFEQALWLGVDKKYLQLAQNVVTLKSCECGAHKVGHTRHAYWCPLDSKE